MDEDKYGKKPKLADTQHYYEIDLDAASIPGGAYDSGAEGAVDCADHHHPESRVGVVPFA